jgi:hypothetical protein
MNHETLLSWLWLSLVVNCPGCQNNVKKSTVVTPDSRSVSNHFPGPFPLLSLFDSDCVERLTE